MPRSKTELSYEKFNLYMDIVDESEMEQCKNQAERAALLHFKYHFSRAELLKLGEVTKKIYEHMIKAKRECRDFGRRGRPRALADADEETLVKEIEADFNNGIKIGRKDIANKVCNVSFSFLCISSIFDEASTYTTGVADEF